MIVTIVDVPCLDLASADVLPRALRRLVTAFVDLLLNEERDEVDEERADDVGAHADRDVDHDVEAVDSAGALQ